MTEPRITEPAFISLETANGARIQGRFVEYTDPMQLSPYEPFVLIDADGTTHYIHGATIGRVTVFGLNAPGLARDE